MRVVFVIRFQNVLTCFVLMDLPLLVHAELGGICYRKDTEECSTIIAKHIEPMDSCLYLNSVTERPINWLGARRFCEHYGGALPEPNTEKKAKALCEYAKKRNVTTYWIGLSYDEDIQDFIWLQNKMPIKNGYKPINPTSTKRECVNALVREECEWRTSYCNPSVAFFCASTSELMPGRPKISVSSKIGDATIVAGSLLIVKCEALLSTKGDLRIALISNNTVEVFNEKNHDGAYYKETLKYDKRNRCKRHGSISIIFKTTLDMDGKTVACVNYKDEAIQMCSQYDPYCDVAGTIRVAEAPVSKWWLLLILPILVMFFVLGSTILKKLRNRESISTTIRTVEADSASKYESSSRSTATEGTSLTVTDE